MSKFFVNVRSYYIYWFIDICNLFFWFLCVTVVCHWIFWYLVWFFVSLLMLCLWYITVIWCFKYFSWCQFSWCCKKFVNYLSNVVISYFFSYGVSMSLDDLTVIFYVDVIGALIICQMCLLIFYIHFFASVSVFLFLRVYIRYFKLCYVSDYWLLEYLNDFSYVNYLTPCFWLKFSVFKYSYFDVIMKFFCYAVYLLFCLCILVWSLCDILFPWFYCMWFLFFVFWFISCYWFFLWSCVTASTDVDYYTNVSVVYAFYYVYALFYIAKFSSLW